MLDTKAAKDAAVIEEQIAEGKQIIGQVGEIKYDMARDHPLPYASRSIHLGYP